MAGKVMSHELVKVSLSSPSKYRGWHEHCSGPLHEGCF